MFFFLYRDLSDQWRWTLYAANNKKIADSAESYINKVDALYAINLVKNTTYSTPVRED